MIRDLTQLDKLEKYLQDNDFEYERIDEESVKVKISDSFYWTGDRHQIVVPSLGDDYKWDAVCHRGSYGADKGLLEVIGTIVPDGYYDRVMGWMTADEVIELIEGKNAKV